MSTSILAGYGLSATVGPVEPTKADMKRYNSRSGFTVSGSGNWMQNYRPRPIIPDGRPKKMYDYELGDVPVVQSRLPGLSRRKIGKFRGLKKVPVEQKVGALRDSEGYITRSDIQDWLAELNSYRMDTSNGTAAAASAAARSEATNSSDNSSQMNPSVRRMNIMGPNGATNLPVPHTDVELRNAIRLYYGNIDSRRDSNATAVDEMQVDNPWA